MSLITFSVTVHVTYIYYLLFQNKISFSRLIFLEEKRFGGEILCEQLIMYESCSGMKRSFCVRTCVCSLKVLYVLFNTGVTFYNLISNVTHYGVYENRASYVVYHVPNTTSNYYIIRADQNDSLKCSGDSLFTFDMESVYKNIISKESRGNLVFISAFWLSTGWALIVSLIGISSNIKGLCTHDRSSYEDVEVRNGCIRTIIISISTLFLVKSAFLFPRYVIGIFDYGDLCLTYHSELSLFVFRHTYIGLVLSLVGAIYWFLYKFVRADTKVTARIRDDSDDVCLKCIEVLSCGNGCVAIVLRLLLTLGFIVSCVFGIVMLMTSWTKSDLKTAAILMCFNFGVGLINELIKLCHES